MTDESAPTTEATQERTTLQLDARVAGALGLGAIGSLFTIIGIWMAYAPCGMVCVGSSILGASLVVLLRPFAKSQVKQFKDRVAEHRQDQ